MLSFAVDYRVMTAVDELGGRIIAGDGVPEPDVFALRPGTRIDEAAIPVDVAGVPALLVTAD